MPQQELDLSVCIPVLNEVALRQTVIDLKQVLDRTAYRYEVIIIDDGSSDGCIETVKDLGVRVIRHRRNLGGGIARMTGIRYSRAKIILQTDADGTYPTNKVPEMLDRMKHADMVIGARNRESATDWRPLRILMKTILRLLAERISGHRIPDLNSGLRVYHRDTALRYGFLYPRGHSIMSTMTLSFLVDGLRVEFVEVDYRVREGKSSFRPIRDTYNYFTTILRTTLYFDPLRVLVPPIVVIGIAALVLTVRNFIQFATLGTTPILFWTFDALLFVLALLSDQFSRISRQIAYLDSTVPYYRDVYEDENFPIAGAETGEKSG